MAKEAPVAGVSRLHKRRNSTSLKKRKTSRPPKRGNKKKFSSKGTPRWLVYLLAAFIILFFILVFYYFFIRPYSYRWKSCYGFREYDICMPFGYQVHGMDISRYQGKINWEELKLNQSQRYPLQFVFVKATEGGDFKDINFNDNFESARKHGIIRGAYHFYIPSTPPEKQADFFINTVKLDSGDLPPVLDIEVMGKKEPEELRKNLKIWLDKIEEHYKVKPILYTSFKFKTRFLSDSTFNSYPYWIAHYYVDSVAYQGEWKFWQHTDRAVVPGIPDRVDLNIFNGSLRELTEMTLR